MQNNNLLNQMNPDMHFLDAEPAGIAPIERFPKPLPRRQENKPDKRIGSVYLLLEQIIAQADQIGIDMLGAARADTLRCLGIDLRQYLPDAQSVLMTGQAYPAGAFQPAGGKKQIDRGKRSDPDIAGIYAVRQLLKHNSQRLAQVIREKAGFTVVTPLRINRNNLVIACGFPKISNMAEQ